MPLSHLGELLGFAYKEEEYLIKRVQEKELFPLWLVNYGISILNNTEIMSFEEFLNTARDSGNAKADNAINKSKAKRTADEILNEFKPIIEADRKRGE